MRRFTYVTLATQALESPPYHSDTESESKYLGKEPLSSAAGVGLLLQPLRTKSLKKPLKSYAGRYLFDPVAVLIDSKGLLQVQAVDVSGDSFQHPLIGPSEVTTRQVTAVRNSNHLMKDQFPSWFTRLRPTPTNCSLFRPF